MNGYIVAKKKSELTVKSVSIVDLYAQFNTLGTECVVRVLGCPRWVSQDGFAEVFVMVLPWLLVLELVLYAGCFICGIMSAASLTITQVRKH